MSQNFSISEIRDTVMDAINDKLSFKELRKKLPGVRKSQLLSTTHDIMEELKITMPFPDAYNRPRLKRTPLAVTADGMVDINALLQEKGYTPTDCIACPTIGVNRITLTIKKSNNNE